jgi:hypothetical protein
MTDRYPHAGWCSVHGAYDAPLAPGDCTCGATAQQSAFEAGKLEADARAMAVVDRCLRDLEVEQICWFCDYAQSKPPSHWFHEDECPLVSQGFITKDGVRRG